MTTYKELADYLDGLATGEFGTTHPKLADAAAILRGLDAQRPTVDEVMKLAKDACDLVSRHVTAIRERGDIELASMESFSAMENLRTAIEALAAPVAAQPPSHAVIAGVLFDFMGWLTTRKERLCLSSVDDASPAVTAITDFAKMRNLSLDNAMVTDWQTGAACRRDAKPNLFWNNDDPESPYNSIDEFLNEEWCQTGIEVGDTRTIQRAIRLTNVTVRVTAVSEDGDIDYIVEEKDAAIDAAVAAQEKA